MQREFDFDTVPSKIFVDSVSIRIINGVLHLAIRSGQSVSCYLLPLPLAKIVGKAIGKQVEEIEQKNNITFDDRLPNEPMLSPWTSQNPNDDSRQKKKFPHLIRMGA